MLNSNLQRVGLVVFWMLTTAIAGMAVALTVPLAYLTSLEQYLAGSAPWTAALAAPLAGALGGGSAGLLQWLVLRRILAQAHGWVLASILGWAAGLTVGIFMFLWLIPDGLNIFVLLIPAGAAGIIVASTQWRVLRSQVSGMGWWLAAGATGWMLALIVSLGISGGNQQVLTSNSGLFILGPGALFGAVVGFQSGFALVVLLSYAFQVEEGTQHIND
ncbi:MAG: hypothetical protein R3335_14335 [Anaerolineales bacterium]|nr:hypothetical protein [Anaerolineales bacterium]